MDVQLHGLRGSLARLGPDQLRARLSLAGAEPGEVTLRVLPEHITVPPGVTVLRVNPSRIRLTLAAPTSSPGELERGSALMSRLFGTDGIRGPRQHAEPLTTELAFRLGRQLVATLLEHHGVKKVRLVVGRDTRLSGPMLEGALVSGALSAGADVYTVGVLPTPAIAFLTRRLESHGGVVLSASHNPFADNGIKIFSSEGAKFPDAWEHEIEGRLAGPDDAPRSPPGPRSAASCPTSRPRRTTWRTRARRLPVRSPRHDDRARLRPRRHVPGGAPRCSGASARGCIVLGARPDGQNINRGAARSIRTALRKRVLRRGRGSRARLRRRRRPPDLRWTSTGEIRDGDYALAICGRHLASKGRLEGGRRGDHGDGEPRASTRRCGTPASGP